MSAFDPADHPRTAGGRFADKPEPPRDPAAAAGLRASAAPFRPVGRRRQVGAFPVDGGSCTIGDPSAFHGMDGALPEDGVHRSGNAVTCGSGFGDGEYDVVQLVDDDGRVVGIEAVFTGPAAETADADTRNGLLADEDPGAYAQPRVVGSVNVVGAVAVGEYETVRMQVTPGRWTAVVWDDRGTEARLGIYLDEPATCVTGQPATVTTVPTPV